MPDHESREQLLSEIANLQKQVEELRNLENRHASAEATLRGFEAISLRMDQSISRISHPGIVALDSGDPMPGMCRHLCVKVTCRTGVSHISVHKKSG